MTESELLLLFDGVGSDIPQAQGFHRDGMLFRRDDGSIEPFLGASEFPALRHQMDGQDMEPFYADRYAVGERLMSVFLTSEDPPNALGDGGPYSDQAILDALGPFADELRDHGFALEACAFQATRVTMPQVDRQVRFWNSVLDIAAARPWVTVSVSKEPWKQQGSLDFSKLRRPTAQSWDGGAVRDGGAWGLQIVPGIWVPEMQGTHNTFQAGRTDDWPRKTKSAAEIAWATRRGCLTGETMGSAEVAQPGRRSNVPNDFEWSALIARLTSLGCYAHGDNHARSEILEPKQRLCTTAVFRGLNTIPLDVQTWNYAKAMPRGFAVEGWDDQPNRCLRTYGMVNPGGNESWVVVCRPNVDRGDLYPKNGDLIDPKVINGWQIVERLGPMGTVLHCRR